MKQSIVSKVFSILTFQRRFSIGVVRLLAGMFDALFAFPLKRHHGSTFHGTARLDSARFCFFCLYRMFLTANTPGCLELPRLSCRTSLHSKISVRRLVACIFLDFAAPIFLKSTIHLRRLAAVSYTHLTLPTTPYV